MTIIDNRIVKVGSQKVNMKNINELKSKVKVYVKPLPKIAYFSLQNLL